MMSYRELGRELKEGLCSIGCGRGGKPKPSRGRAGGGESEDGVQCLEGGGENLPESGQGYILDGLRTAAGADPRKRMHLAIHRTTGSVPDGHRNYETLPPSPSSVFVISFIANALALDLLGTCCESSCWDCQTEPTQNTFPR